MSVALKLESKKEIVAEVSTIAADSVAAVVAHYRGLSVAEMTDLRTKARKSGVYLRVVRNTLARRAVSGTEFECLSDSFTGPVVLAFSRTEPSAAARLIRDFCKEHDKLKVTVLAVGGNLYQANQLNTVAMLPTKDESIAQLMAIMKAPITKFVCTLNEPASKLVRLFAAVRDQKAAA
jgi:large subunit ribosomal protein L10